MSKGPWVPVQPDRVLVQAEPVSAFVDIWDLNPGRGSQIQFVAWPQEGSRSLEQSCWWETGQRSLLHIGVSLGHDVGHTGFRQDGVLPGGTSPTQAPRSLLSPFPVAPPSPRWLQFLPLGCGLATHELSSLLQDPVGLPYGFGAARPPPASSDPLDYLSQLHLLPHGTSGSVYCAPDPFLCPVSPVPCPACPQPLRGA